MFKGNALRRIENPLTGDRIEFLASPLHGDAGPLIYRCTLAPNAKGSPLHLHRTIIETFHVERGLLEMEVGAPGAIQALSAGDNLEVAAGQAHSFRSPLREAMVFVSTATSGAQFERFLRSMYGLAADGGTNVDGMPTDLRALALTMHYADLVIPSIPRSAQTVLVGALTGLARVARLERKFAAYWPDAIEGHAIQEAA